MSGFIINPLNKYYKNGLLDLYRLLIRQNFGLYGPDRLAFVYLLAMWFGFAVQTSFSNELLTFLLMKEPNNVDHMEEALASDKFDILITPESFVAKYVIQYWLAANPSRVIHFGRFVSRPHRF